jgi:hypothetical protein
MVARKCHRNAWGVDAAETVRMSRLRQQTASNRSGIARIPGGIKAQQLATLLRPVGCHISGPRIMTPASASIIFR